MTVTELLAELRRRDIRVWREGGRLRYDAPKGALTSELRGQITRHRAELLELLSPGGESDTPPLTAVARDGDLPLSFGQQRLWFLDQLEPESLAYNVPATIQLLGPLDAPALRRSLDLLVTRHETLRTTFPTVDGQPHVAIAPPAEFTLREEDLGNLPADQRLIEARRRVHGDATTRFDLARGPLARGLLLRLDDDDHVLHITMHHIVSDGWSLGILFKELTELYEALRAGRPSPLPPLDVQYVDFARWQQRMLDGKLKRDLEYWRNQLADFPTLRLPTDRPRPMAQSHRGKWKSFSIPVSLLGRLERLGQRREATMFMTLLAAFNVLLARHSGQHDIVVGTPIAGRSRQELERIIGFFVNNLVLRNDLGDDPSFTELLRRVRRVALDAFAHSEAPFDKLVEELQPERELGRNPLFQVLFNHFNMEGRYETHLRSLELQQLPGSLSVSKFDLTLHCYEESGRLITKIEYNTDLFDEETIERLGQHYVNLLQGIADDPERPVSQLPILGEEERQRLLVEWNQTREESPRDRCVPQLFEDRARETPLAPAVQFEDRRLSYAELEQRTRSLALSLRALGIGPEDRVALYFDRSCEMVVGLMGVLRAGGAYVPIDPVYPRDRLAFMLADSGAKVILTRSSLIDELPAGETRVLCLDREEMPASASPDVSLPEVGTADLAYVMYTSGTTGRPKGVQVEQGQLLNYVQGVLPRLDLPPGSSFATVSTLAADLGNTSIYGALCSGGCLHVMSEERIGNGDAFAEYVHHHEVDCIKIVPSHLEALLTASRHPERVLPKKLLVVGGEASSWELLERIRSLSPRLEMVNHYGPTEATVGVLTHRIRSDDRSRYPAGPPIGRPIANTRAYLLDGNGQPVPIGVAGELYVGGSSVTRGYLNLPEQTERSFVEDPFGNDGPLYRTGDLARYTPDGALHFLGRADDQVKVRGFRIELGEIQACLERHPALTAAAVVVHEPEEGHRQLVAYVVTDASPVPAPGDLREFLRERLPDYMIPTAWIPLDRLPLTPNGKLDRKALPAPRVERSESDETYVAPRSGAERTLVRIWSEVLRVDRVGVQDNFFELGGESIISIQVISRANQAGLHLTPRDLFENPTIAGLARVAGTAPTVSAEQGPVTGEVPLTPIQHRFFELDAADPHHYNQAMLLKARRPLDTGAFERACQALLDHHDALRLCSRRTDTGWVQEIADASQTVSFTVEDLSALAEDEGPAALEARASQLQAGMDLARGPLILFALFRLGDVQGERLLIAIHHTAVDGVSWRILLEDLQTAYAQALDGRPVQLPPKTSSYRTWGRRLVEYARSDAALAEREYWLQVAQRSAASLPVDHPEERPDLAVSHVDVVPLELDADETQLLLNRVPKAYRTRIDEVLLTALTRAVASWTGSPSVRLDLEGHGREPLFDDVDLSRTVGWFTSVYPVVLEFDEGQGPGEQLRSIKEQLRSIPGHGIGWSVLRYLGGDEQLTRQLRATSAPEICFNYLGQFDQAFSEDALFDRANESGGVAVSARNRRRYLLDVTAVIRRGRLRLNWIYNRNVQERSTIEALSDRFGKALRELIDHCVSVETPLFTPSDFPLARLNQSELDRIQERYREQRIEDICVLSPLQQGMLYHTLIEPESATYITQLAFTLRGSLAPARFEQAWREALERQPVLRTGFAVDRIREMHQIVCRRISLRWHEDDWRDLDAAEREQRLAQVADEDRRRGFDLAVPPLMRLRLIRTGEETHRFIWTHHHVLLDGWSLPILMAEVFRAYSAAAEGAAARPDDPRPFTDYIRWLERQDASEAKAYWIKRFEGWPGPTALPIAEDGATKRGPAQPRRRGLALSEESTAALQEVAAASRLTVNTLVQGAWALLLSRYGDTTDVTFGVTVAGRPGELPGVETMLGMFINTLPMRVDTSDAPLLAWLHRIQTQQLELGQYEYTPLYEVQQLVASGGATGLFDSILVFENFPVEPTDAVRLGGLKITDPRDVSFANYPLAAVIRPGKKLHLELRYDGRRVEERTTERLLEHFASLLQAMADRPDANLAELPMIDEAERQRLLIEWNDTATDYPSRHAVHRLFEEQAARTPDAVAVAYGDRHLTYAALNRRANRLAHHLIQLGVRSGTLVGICTERGLDTVVGTLGILKAGGAYVPLDTAYPEQRLAFMLEDTQTPVLLTEEALAGRFADYAGHLIRLDTDWEQIATASDDNPTEPASADGLAYVIYTSGSTGKPKGVCIPHRAICRLVLGTDYVKLSSHDRIAQAANVSFDAATFEIWGALLTGARLVGVAKDVALSPHRFAEAIREEGITVLFVTTALFNQLAVQAPGCFKPLRYLLFGGEAVDPARVRAVLAHDPPENLLHVYGPTENTTFSTWYRVDQVPDDARTVPIGRPIANTICYVLDRDMNPTPDGVPGELYVGGDGLALGYLNRPELTAERFLRSPFHDDDSTRLYHTGDVVRRLADGSIEFIGRHDNQIKLRGFRIELGEIETALVQQPDVRDAVVLCREDRPGDKRLVGYVVPQGEPAPSRSGLRTSLGEKLPEHMVPSTFVFLDALPLTPNGKVDRRALPAPTAERQTEEAYLAPRGELEERIAAIWREVLGIEHVGVRDNFFDLGGHSLRLLQVHARILDELGHEIPVTELFEYPTIEALVRQLGREEESGARLHLEAQARVGRRGIRGNDSIAVIGMAGRFPGAADLETFWDNLVNGVESVRFFTDEELREAGVAEALINDPRFVKARAVIDDVERFDARFFGYNPREAELLDPQHRVFLECAWETFERAGYDPRRYEGMIGVFAGVSMSTYLWNLMSRPDLLGQAGGMQVMISTDKDYLPTRVSYKLNLRGPSVNVQSACSTGLVAVHEACRSLLDHQCDMAMAGGVSITVPTRGGYLYEEEGIRSPDGHNRAFDARAQGTVTGSGAAIVLLKRLDEALADGDHVHAVIRGTAINNDGSNKVGYTAPSVEGQAAVIALAQACAGVDPETISYVEAHGTATALGDPIEVAALTKAFRERTDKRGFCGLGTLKSNMGHLNEAAGVGGLIKTVLALEHGQIPPSLHYERPNPEIDFDDSPFFVVTQCREWKTSNGVPRRAAVSAFGLGGTNAHAVLEEAPEAPPSDPSRVWQLLTVSAKTASALETATRNLATHLGEADEVDLADVAFTLALGRGEFDFRRTVVCRDAAGAVNALEGGDVVVVSTGRVPARAPSTVFMFPGHGHQHLNMGRGVYESEAAFRNTVDECLSHLRDRHDLDLSEALYPKDPDSRDSGTLMERPTIFQPAVFVIDYAMAQLWRSWGLEPTACIGHSLGEYVAACVAEVLSLEDALDLVVLRGHLMEQTPPGAMLVVSLPETRLLEFLADENDVWLSTINAPSLCLVSGKPDRIDAFAERLTDAGVECNSVAASHAYHSAMMESAAAPLAEAVRQITLGAPRIPYLSNVTGDWITEEQVRNPEYWARHLCAPVRFSDGLELLLEDPGTVLLEVGPGRILGSLTRMHPNCAPERKVVSSMRHPTDEAADMATLLGAAGRLWIAGLPLDWSRFFGGERRRRVSLPTYPFERKRYWVERRASSTTGPWSSSGRKSDVADWFYVPVWRPGRIPDAAPAEAEARSCLAFVDDTDFSNEMVRRLEQDGFNVVPVCPGKSFSFSEKRCTIDPASPEDYARLVAQLQKRDSVPTLVAHLWCARPSPARLREDDTEAQRCQDLGFHSLLHLSRALEEAEVSTPVRIVVVTEGLHEVTGDELLQPEKATILGPCRVLGREFSNLSCRNVDLAAEELLRPSQEFLDRIVRELLSDSPDAVVAYRGQRRWVESFTPLRLEQAQETLPAPLRSGGTYLITGGLTGVGLALAGYLAAARANLILIGRTPLPERAAWADHVEAHGEEDPVSRRIRAVQVLEELGSQVMPLQADVSDLGRMQAVVDEALERFDRIDGVVHAAGVPAAGLIMLQEPGQAARGLAPKVTGARVLERLFRERGLDFLVLCSSLNSVKGVPGLVDYSAANAYLDVFARRFGSDTGTPTVTINWNRWREVGMAAEASAKPLGEADGVSNLEGIEIFRRILASKTEPRVLVSEFDLWAVLASAQSGGESSASAEASESERDDEVEERPDLLTEFTPPETEMEKLLAEIWQQVLGIDRVGVNDSFMELGGHSLAMLKVMSRLEERTGVKVNLRALFHQTLGQIAAVCQERAAEAPQGSQRAAGGLLSKLGRFVSKSKSDDDLST